MSAYDPKQSLAMPQEIEHWSLSTLREKLVKIGAKMVRHGRDVTFQMAEVAVCRDECSDRSWRASRGCVHRLCRIDPSGGRRVNEIHG